VSASPCAARPLAALAILVSLLSVPAPALGWSSYRVESYILDLALDSEQLGSAHLTLEIEVLGGRFRGFRVARGDEGLSWTGSSMYCENPSGKRFVLERVSRADGLTDFRFSSPGYIPRGGAVCSVDYTFNPALAGSIQLLTGEDPHGAAAEKKVQVSIKTPGLPVSVEELAITLHLPPGIASGEVSVGDLASEEYAIERFPSAVTLRRYRPPAYYTAAIDVILPASALEGEGAADGGPAGGGGFVLERHVGIPSDERIDGLRSLWLFAILAAAALGVILLKHRSCRAADSLSGGQRPYLLLPSMPAAARFAASAILLVVYAILACAGRDAVSILALGAAMLLALRGGLVLGAADGDACGEWSETSTAQARRTIASCASRESRARLFLDAATLPGICLLAASSIGLAALAQISVPYAPDTGPRLAAGGSVVLALAFLTSTSVGGCVTLARRVLGRLVDVQAEYSRAGLDPPALCLRQDPSRDGYPEMRLRKVLDQGSSAVIEVGVELRRGWRLWRSSYAVVVRLDARLGALIADGPWLERAEIHANLDCGRTAIVVRTRDPAMALRIEDGVSAILSSGRLGTDGRDAFARLRAEPGCAATLPT